MISLLPFSIFSSFNMEFFPTEIITIILTNLPPKSIFKCKSVCKTWNSIITNPSFPDLHFKSSSGNYKSHSFILQSTFFHEIYIATQHEILPNTYTTRKLNLTYNNLQDCKLYTKPSVNGIVLFHTSKLTRKCCMFVFNPVTLECRSLPNFSLPKFTIARLILGFGFHESRGVYKVVLIFLPMGNRAVQSDVQVLTLGCSSCSSWRTIGKAPTMGFINDYSVFVNGALHWLAKKDLDLEEGSIGFSSFKVYIVTFHMSSEEFGVLSSSPELSFLGNDNSSRFQLVVLGGCLSVVDSSQNEVMEIWMMKDYNVDESWMRYRISKYDLNGVLYKTIFPLSFRKNGEIVLLYGMKLIAYNTEDENYTSIELKGLPTNSLPRGIMSLYFSRAFSCVESLIPLKRACTIDGKTGCEEVYC